jgi:(2Fe-2S) ferredoxin
VCTNDRHGARKSCADGDNVEIRQALKQSIAEKGLKGKVRVSQSGCLGLCEDGPNVIMYPQKIWLCGVTKKDIPDIIARIEEQAG